MPCVIAIDAGTTSVRSVAVDLDGTILQIAQRPLTQHYPQPGWVEHDAEEIWTHVQGTLTEVQGRLARRGETIDAIGITNQRESVVAWDRQSGQTLHRVIVWQDRRTAKRCEELAAQGHLPLIRERTGLVLDPYFSATKMKWLLDQAGLRAEAERGDLAFGTVDSWLLWKLTGGTDGGEFVTDPTNASRTLLYDITERRWHPELAQLFTVPLRVLPEVRPSCGRFGLVHPSALQRGALGGTPVSGVAGDQQAALFGQACFEPGMAKVTYGTGSFVLLNCGPTAPDAVEGLVVTTAWDLGAHGPSEPVAYALEGSAFNSGSAIQWLRDELGVIREAAETEPLARSVDGTDGVAFVPAFTGTGSPWWDPGARGTIVGLSRGTTTAHLARAVVEAMAYQVRAMVEAMTGAGTANRVVSQLRADGGAAVMDLLLQIQADQVRLSVARPRSTETTALGAAYLAGLAEGVWTDLSELSRLWHAQAEFIPNEDQAIADLGYAAWLRAVDNARGWVRN